MRGAFLRGAVLPSHHLSFLIFLFRPFCAHPLFLSLSDTLESLRSGRALSVSSRCFSGDAVPSREHFAHPAAWQIYSISQSRARKSRNSACLAPPSRAHTRMFLKLCDVCLSKKFLLNTCISRGGGGGEYVKRQRTMCSLSEV